MIFSGNNSTIHPAAAWLRLLRPAQWSKNAVVPAAYFFARWDPGQAVHAMGWRPALRVLLATLLFCLVSSGIYALNDVVDRESDAQHPRKRLRPVAAGQIRPRSALLGAGFLLVGAISGAWLLSPRFAEVAMVYSLMQLAYSWRLKRVALLDVFLIAAGFVLRAVAGASAIEARISPWLLLCTFLLALFLALCKRRHEKQAMGADGSSHRGVLANYDLNMLDQLIAITSAATIVAYAMYTLAPDTIERFGTGRLGLTIPFVIFGIFRYLNQVHRGDGGGAPEKTLLTDKVLLSTIMLYLLTALAVFLWG